MTFETNGLKGNVTFKELKHERFQHAGGQPDVWGLPAPPYPGEGQERDAECREVFSLLSRADAASSRAPQHYGTRREQFLHLFSRDDEVYPRAEARGVGAQVDI